jgi:dihydrodipicolinate synthase/N-acetylneuraminate lyase
MPELLDPIAMLRPRREVTGFAAVLLPFTETGEIDWRGFDAHLERTAAAGLIPAVNMDTGYVNLLDDAARLAVLDRAKAVLDSHPYAAGAFVADQPGSSFNAETYAKAIAAIVKRGGLPVIFQSYGLIALPDAELLAAYESLGRDCDGFLAFELGNMFAPFGAIYSLDVYRGLLGIAKCRGAKHSSLSRELEWQRLKLRDALRPGFKVLTGNDLAIDMVMYGSDYLLGLATFAPDLFAKRDAFWLAGDPRFYELNDALQYLGCFAFREPVPAYKHSVAMVLKLRGWLHCDRTHPKSPPRPDSDRDVLAAIVRRLEAFA